MGVRSRMTMRATIERNEAGTDAYGQPGPPDWKAIAVDVPCYAWSEGKRMRIGDEKTVVLDGPGMVLSLGTDVTEKDRIRSVSDRLDAELFDTMYIDAVARRRDHLELRLRDYA